MGILFWLLIVLIIAVSVTFVLLKIRLKKKLDDIDGFGGTVKNADDQKIISAFGGSIEN